MRTLCLAAALVICATANSFAVGPTPAGAAPDNPPRYLVIQPMYDGQATPLRAHAYAYGWFGAGSYSSSTGHRNYNGLQYWWTYTPGY